MKLKLTKPLVVFDLEATGLDISKDRIIQLSYIKVWPDGKENRQAYFINPECKIPEVVVELTHITNEMVAAAPTFKMLAPSLSAVFDGCDFAGYNSNHFDIPLLAEEFIRSGVEMDFSKCRLVDAMVIFQRMEQRNLGAAYKFYCGRKMEDDFTAHRADEDTEATWRVLQAQLDMYSADNQDELERILPNDMDALHEMSKYSNNIDFAGRLVWKEMKDGNGKAVLDDDGKPKMKEAFNFGKYKNMFVSDVLRADPNYYAWMMSADFPRNTKQALTKIRMKELCK